MASEPTLMLRGMFSSGWPSNKIAPPLGWCNPAISLARVLLPLPLPPTRAIRIPG